MLKVNSYSAKGVKSVPITLPKDWEAKENVALLSQAVRVYEAKAHVGLSSTKTRAEVNRTTKKLYRQKGTGGARHGSRKAPIFVGGGVAGGPRPLKRKLNLPTAMKRKAIAVAMSAAVKEERVVAAGLEFKKTSEANSFLNKVIAKNKKATFVISSKNSKVAKFIKNLKNVKVLVFPSLNARDIFYGGLIVLDKEIFKK